mmetsp:Transcript_12797/g.19153  ORF Transcript_12797/g.19153 Transcript_12797/m.19153 type:complete len:251 (-) Transcript_12797:419-1171(-)
MRRSSFLFLLAAITVSNYLHNINALYVTSKDMAEAFEMLSGAVRKGDVELIKNSVRMPGFDEVINETFDIKGQKEVTVLIYACFHKLHSGANPDTIRALLDIGADPKVSDTDGLTILHVVASQGQIDIARMLVEDYELDVNSVVPADGLTPLARAAIGITDKHVYTARFLIESGADPNEPLCKKSDCVRLIHVAKTYEMTKMFAEYLTDSEEDQAIAEKTWGILAAAKEERYGGNVAAKAKEDEFDLDEL